MPRIIDELTPEEENEIKRIDEEFRPLLDAAQAKTTAAMDAWFKASEKASKEKRPLTAEESALGGAMTAAGDECSAINDKWLEARAQVTRKAETRVFDSYRDNIDAIMDLIKRDAPRLIAVYSIFAGDEPTEGKRR